MKLVPLMTMHADLKAPADVGKGPYGQRTISISQVGPSRATSSAALSYPAAANGC